MRFMNFLEYWQSLSPEQKANLAARSNTSIPYLSQVAHGHRKAGAGLIERLMVADKKISFQMMRFAA